MRRKIILPLVVVLFLTLMLFGCNTGTAATTTQASQETTQATQAPATTVAATTTAETTTATTQQSNQSPKTIIYNIYATDNTIKLADGTDLYVYGFVGGREGQPFSYMDNEEVLQTMAAGPPAPTGGPVVGDEAKLLGCAQVPGPVIYCEVGDTVQINFKNLGVTNKKAPNDPHSIHLHGLDVNAANDGVPETSIAAVPANAKDQKGAGNVVVYQFTPKVAGTYMYHCHQEADIHVQMGMYAALVVYNVGDPAASNGGPGKGFGGEYAGFKYDKDYIMLLSEVDIRQHYSEDSELEKHTTDQKDPFYFPTPAFNPVDYNPQYWLINGLSFPETIHAGANWADWIQAYTNYDPFITGSSGKGEKVLVRVINLGFETQPMHVHGFHAKVLGMDQRPWTFANPPGTPTGEGLEMNTFTIGSGNTMELLFDFATQKVAGDYSKGTQSRYDTKTGLPLDNTSTDNPAIPDSFGGGDYHGGPSVPNLFPFHNHDDYKATNNGVYPGGQFTMVLVNP